MIAPDGYNLGRDWIVQAATAGTRYRNHWWTAEVEWRTDLLAPGSDGSFSLSPLLLSTQFRTQG